jgi:ABC-type multidrug transport system, ATPase and permease components
MQKSVVLNGTMRHNITMGKPDATEAELESAAETAQLLNYIKSLPDGFEHMLEQNGTNISGGQKQRVAIARAVIKDAPVYVFDDSFSALDFLIESKLRRSLNERLKGKTQIIITQRVATAMSADVIYVFDKGKIVGNGNHRELMQSCPVYKEIYDSQIGGDLNEK